MPEQIKDVNNMDIGCEVPVLQKGTEGTCMIYSALQLPQKSYQ